MSEEFVRKTIKLNKSLWNNFQTKIEEIYGTTYKHTSTEIEKAIENYINNDVVEIEKTKTKINNLNDENKHLKELNKKLENDNKKNTNEILSLKTKTKKDHENITDLKEEISKLNSDKTILEKDILRLKEDVKRLNEEKTNLKQSNERILNNNKDLEEKYIEQVDETNRQIKENIKIKNKREHAQERLNKTQDELNNTLRRLEKYSFAIGQVKNMSFIDRLFNRLPEEIKELQPGKEEEDIEN